MDLEPAVRMLEPASVEELREMMCEEHRVCLEGSGSKRGWRNNLWPLTPSPETRSSSAGGQGEGSLAEPPEEPSLSVWKLDGVIEFSPNDQVVSVRAGTHIEHLQDALGQSGQCLPLRRTPELRQSLGTVGGSLSMNLPHVLEAQCGSWRDWILGMTVVLADGTVAKSGSHAVKNVAGYDVHKLFVGARGILGVVVEVILRTYPLRSLPQPELRHRGVVSDPHVPMFVQRVLPADMERAAFDGPGFDDMAASTIWRWGGDPRRMAEDWVMRCHSEDNVRIEDDIQRRLMERAKAIFDPDGKLNSGEFGIG